jgi:hypothetical protein
MRLSPHGALHRLRFPLDQTFSRDAISGERGGVGKDEGQGAHDRRGNAARR